MRNCLVLASMLTFAVMASGCCKGLKSQDGDASQASNAVVVEQVNGNPSMGPVVDDGGVSAVSMEKTADAQEEKAVVEATADNQSSMTWIIYLVMAALIGWLVYKFIFRKR